MNRLILPLLPLVLIPINAACSQPRIRKSWDRLRAEGGTALYMEAVDAAIQQGYHQDFSAVHVGQTAGNDEAHRKGSFLYWHRMFLLAYENMLRSLDPKFECLTIPYWNYFHENDLLLASNGANLLDVSNICNELQAGPAARTNWARYVSFPSIALPSTMNGLNSNAFRSISRHIENTVHNSIHNWLGGSMSSYQSPLDPIFYSHHATIDLLQTIYYDCKAGRGQSDAFKRTSSVAYHPWGGAPSSNAGFTVNPSSRIARFFNSLPTRYYHYVDAAEIPSNGYTYLLDNNFNLEKTRLTSCSSDPPATDPPATDPPATDAPATTDAPTTAPTPTPSDADKNMNEFYDELLEECKATGMDEVQCNIQARRTECLCFDDIVGVEDFTDEFRKNFNISDSEHTECAQTVIDFEQAEKDQTVKDLIAVDEKKWKDICYEHFGDAKIPDDKKNNPKDIVRDPSTASISSLGIFSILLPVLVVLW